MISKITTLLSLLLLLLTSSCHRQRLEEFYYSKALIPILINWEEKALMYVDNDPDDDLYSASLWLFPREGSDYQGDPIEYRLTNPVFDYIEAPIGVYDVLVFNKTVGEFSSNVGFRGTDKFETFEYYTKPYLNSQGETVEVDGRELRLEPDLLAAWRSPEDQPFVVTLDMIQKIEGVQECQREINEKYFFVKDDVSSKVLATNITKSDFDSLSEEFTQLVILYPERLTHIVTVEHCVKNLNSAASASGVISGMSESVIMAPAEYSAMQTSGSFDLTGKYITSEDGKDGYVDGSVRVIGPLHHDYNPTYNFLSKFVLKAEYEGSLIYPTPPADAFSYGVTDQVYDGEEKMGLDKIIPLCICGFDDGGGGVVLPDTSFGSGGFDVSVNDWDDEIDIPL
ncbi:MAG: DUF5119 domain-containing protein [Rikenellaceae bacterium]